MPKTVFTDAHAGWTCSDGGSLIVEAMTPGPGALGTLHAVIYACPAHQSDAEARIASVDCWYPAVRTMPVGPGDPWPCGRVGAYDADMTAEEFVQRSQ